MRVLRKRDVLIRTLAVVLFVVGALALVSETKPPYGPHQKAFYADPQLVNFVRPGLVVTILSAEISTDGVIKTRFKLADPKGLPLDRLGVTTPGPISTSFIASYVPADKPQYVAYTTRTQTGAVSGTVTQASSDTGGTYEQVGEGEYVYTFRTRAPSGYDRTATHTIGIYSTRNLTEFDMGFNRIDAVFNFRPDGGQVTKVRDVVKTDTCNNKCHDPLALHGGSRQKVELCILCHYPGVIDPDTGNTVDLKVMVHKIHNGADLTKQPYQIIGFGGSVHDYSNVVIPSDARRCTFCHDQNTDAAQKEAWLKPTRETCGSCHDDINWATGEGHLGLPQISDNQCAGCHIPEGEIEFDASIIGAHTIPEDSKNLPGTVFEINEVTNAKAGMAPSVTFTLKDKKGNPLEASKMGRLALVLAGPTSDYAQYVSEDARTASAQGNGMHTYAFKAVIPAGSTGSWSVGIEGYQNITLYPGTGVETAVRDAGDNVVKTFSLDGSEPAHRRHVVSIQNCNECHAKLRLHGNNRNQVVQCVLCHAPNTTDAARRPADQKPDEGIQLAHMIHKIHTGHEIEDEEYTIYGFGNTPHNYNHVGFPGDRRNCAKCHMNNSQQVPLERTLLPVQDPRGLISPMQPTAAACLGCHTSIDAASHALVNTSTLGESCGACHSPDREFSVDKSHAR